MTLTINISEELETKLEIEAKRNGVGKDEFARIVLEEKLGFKPSRPNFSAKIIATDLPVRDFSREHAWLKKHRDEYDGQWVALNGDKLIAAGFDGKEVARKARELGSNGAFITFVEGNHHPRFISGGLWRE